eukprot:365768-Chlamydomonas_euryale.AAC.7
MVRRSRLPRRHEVWTGWLLARSVEGLEAERLLLPVCFEMLSCVLLRWLLQMLQVNAPAEGAGEATVDASAAGALAAAAAAAERAVAALLAAAAGAAAADAMVAAA